VALLACSAFAASSAAPALQQPDVTDVLRRVSMAETERESDVRKLVCTRQYTMRNKRW